MMTEAQKDARLEAYARLAIRSGVNLQKGQRLYLQAPVECSELARLLVREAYAAGASHVTVAYGDEQIARMHYDNCGMEFFESMPEWQSLRNNWLAREGAALLSVSSEDPLLMSGIDPAKPMAAARAAHASCKEFYDALDKGRNQWCIIAAPGKAWAGRVFPDLSADAACDKLWDAICACVRIDDPSPEEAWARHRRAFDGRKAWLNGRHFDALHLSNALGTDLTIGLNAAGLWQGGGDVTVGGVEFFPNMPTEEIFTTPDFRRCDGIVHSSLPLIHNGCRIDGFHMRFEAGRVVEAHAREGDDVLQALISADDGSSRLGEVALVAHDSPISNSGILFFNTLFDENAACHLAIGKGFPDCLANGQEMADDELLAAGVNDSAIHVDFMIGTADMRIDGIGADGLRCPVFVDGNWA